MIIFLFIFKVNDDAVIGSSDTLALTPVAFALFFIIYLGDKPFFLMDHLTFELFLVARYLL